MPAALRHLVLVLGDQLDPDSAAFEGFDPGQDRVLMVEARGESTRVWSHKARIALFLSAMRHAAEAFRARGWPLTYLNLDAPAGAEDEASLASRLRAVLARERPQGLVVVEPGEWQLARDLEAAARDLGIALIPRPDRHFLVSRAEFSAWARGSRGSLRMEFFYREQRRRHGVLMDAQGQPEGGAWNFDADNRRAYPKTGPGDIPPPARFEPDDLTREVLRLVEREFPRHPGRLDRFAWPVTPAQAAQALERFVAVRLAQFGPYQDAMWEDTPFGWHSLLSTSLNLKLIDPRTVLRAAEAAHREGHAPLPGVEGFIRQVLGWREFIRGVYWRFMPELAEANHFGHHRPLPRWWWTGETGMACARDVIRQTLDHGYAHHIQRLMVTGLFALLAGLDPKAVAAWYLAVYVDAVEWVELPNVAGMALFADGGRFTSKPYIASGAYIQRQSNHCAGCRYRPDRRQGPDACPYTVLFWAFLDRHEAALAGNARTVMMARQVQRLAPEARAAQQAEAQALLARLDEV